MTINRNSRLYSFSLLQRLWTLVLTPIVWPIDYLVQRLTQGVSPVSKNLYLSTKTNYGPVPTKLMKSVPIPLQISGNIPKDLRGEFMRVGPNPDPKQDGLYHWFDGDGMIHAVRILDDSNGRPKAYYCNQMPQTDRLIEEQRLGGDIQYMRIGWLFHGPFVMFTRMLWSFAKQMIGYSKKIDPIRRGTANTSIEYHEGRLFALNESSLPFQMRVDQNGWLSSVGYYDYDGQLKHAMTAHPKVDPVSGEMRFIGYQFVLGGPYCFYAVVKDDSLISSVTFSKDDMPNASMIHDMAITQKYSMILDLPLVFDFNEARKGQLPLVFRKDIQARIGILPKHARSAKETKWFNISTCYVFHILNAWEEQSIDGNDEIVVLVASRYNEFHLSDFSSGGHGVPYIWKFNMSTGEIVEEKSLVPDDFKATADFPRCNPQYLSKPCRFGYFAVFEMRETPVIVGIMKLDVTGKVSSKTITYGNEKYAGECYFQPKIGGKNEDDGYLMTFVHDEVAMLNQTELWIMDAKTMTSQPLAKIIIPERIPFGFHCKWITEEEIENQVS